MKKVGEDGGQSQAHSNPIQPDRDSNGNSEIRTQAPLQEERRQTDGSNHHQSKRTLESATAGIDHHQRQSQEQQAGGQDRGTAAGRFWTGIGRGIRHESLSRDLYRRWRSFSNLEIFEFGKFRERRARSRGGNGAADS